MVNAADGARRCALTWPHTAPWATVYRASRRSTKGERAAEFEKREFSATRSDCPKGNTLNSRGWQPTETKR